MSQRCTLGALFVVFTSLGALETMYAQPLTSEPVTREMARKAAAYHIAKAENMWRDISVSNQTAPKVGKVEELKYPETKELIGYVIELVPKGFVVISAYTHIDPVIAFDFQGNFPWEEHPDNVLLQMLRQDLVFRREALPRLSPGYVKSRKDAWQECLSDDSPDLRIVRYPIPDFLFPTQGLVRTTWTQGGIYNECCPVDTFTGDRCSVGCGATAMAQVVNYWAELRNALSFVGFFDADTYTSERVEYPNSGSDTDTVIIKIDADWQVAGFPSFSTVNVIAPIISMQYLVLPDSVPSSLSGPWLSYICGVSIGTKYSSRAGSSSGISSVQTALLNKFDYFSAEVFYPSDSAISFYDSLYTNILTSRPAVLRLTETGTRRGHAIVCDGAAWVVSGERLVERDIYHLNFGWGSKNPDDIKDAWYKLPDGMPAGYDIISHGVLNIMAPK